MRIAGLVPALLLSASLAAFDAAAARCAYDIRLHDPAALILDVQVQCDGADRIAFERPGGQGMAAALTAYVEGEDGRSLRYGFQLGALADLANTPDIAQRVDDAVISPLAVWLADPHLPGAEIVLRFSADANLAIAHGLSERHGEHHLRGEDIRFGGYAVFGRFEQTTLKVGEADIEAVSFPGRIGLERPVIERWLSDSAAAVAHYFDGFPLMKTLIVAVPVAGRGGVVFGRVRGGGGGTILLRLGEQVQRDQLYDDWILVHEMVHLGAPFVTGRAGWLMEGMATYAEPIIRARAGWRTQEQLWLEFAGQMPRGVTALTRESLDAVSRAGLYWGGAIFMLLADLDIRERTDGRASLETCFRAVLKAGGDTTARWPRQRMLDACDAATGTDTMARLARRYVSQPGDLDLDALWRELGVRFDGRMVTFDDSAPKAALRRAITRGAAQDSGQD